MTALPTSFNDDSQWCNARKRQGDGNCHRPAGWGTDHPGVGKCKLHGGMLNGPRIAGKRMLAEKKARAFLHEQGVRPIIDPVGEFIEFAAEVRATYEFLRDAVAQISVANFEQLDDKGASQVRGLYQAMERAQDRAGRLLHDVNKLGLEERMVALSETHAEQIETVFNNTLAASGLTAEVQAHLRSLLIAELIKVSRQREIDP